MNIILLFLSQRVYIMIAYLILKWLVILSRKHCLFKTIRPKWKWLYWNNNKSLFYCLFVWSFSAHSRIFHSFGNVTTANFDLCSAFVAIEQVRFFRVPHIQWHGASVYKGYLRGPLTLTPNTDILAVELQLPVFNDSVF